MGYFYDGMDLSIMIQTFKQVMAKLQAQADPAVVEGLARFGSRPAQILGIKIPVLRRLAHELGRDHVLALELWDSGIHEARILASMIDVPALVTLQQMEVWVSAFDSWDVCDQVCGNLFVNTPYAYQVALDWCHREPEYVRRAGFVMIATLAVHDKKAPDETFVSFFPLIRQYAVDERKFVKKAVNWALRQIGKRNRQLRPQAIACAQALIQLDSRAARWIARDALRELQTLESA